jgi:rSAM/selenodomain-associated transferase 2
LALSLSIVIPVLNEAEHIDSCVKTLRGLRRQGAEVLVVDGGSSDNTLTAFPRDYVDEVLVSEPGRAYQMNAGATKASGKWLLFLHVDSCLPENMADLMLAWDLSGAKWGFFFIDLNNKRFIFKVIEWFINRRSYYTAIGTGDQCQFVQRDTFNEIGGFAKIPLMEDVDLSKRLKRISKPLIVLKKAKTSSRKWQRDGVLRTVFLMWRIRFEWFLGASPENLVAKYYQSR